MSSFFLDQYEPLDIIGNGSFGIIRKVRRKSDGMTFARKELNFERMSERDRKQIVAEVNILKDLHHEHIVRYHDRYVDRDAGILYILMEYCGGGDLSTIIKHAAKHNRPIPEETIWSYFMQILLALYHCHHPNGHGRSGSGSNLNGDSLENEGTQRRAQILHRDLKPDNVFLDESNIVKLGDFGLSKALAQASFANTYVGTPYYMSPELMQEKAYDSKSDIWSLGCLIYELCALKPPFHEAKTHTELSMCIRNGRIPPLPRGYSQSLSSVIKAMLNLNPAMRPSAAQLLQHERLELVYKVSETQKMLSTVKLHKNNVAAREREVQVREAAVLEREKQLVAVVNAKDAEITSLQQLVAQLQQQLQQSFSQHDVEAAIKDAVVKREEELRILVMKREKEVAEAISRREEEILEAVRKREAEVFDAWETKEAEIRREVEDKIQELEGRTEWLQNKEAELMDEEMHLDSVRRELEDKMVRFEESLARGRREKAPLEEVKNIIAPLSRIVHDTPVQRRKFEPAPTPRPTSNNSLQPLVTPVSRPSKQDFLPSAMKGVVLTATGETLTTPTPAELAKLFRDSPRVGLNFTKIFDFPDSEDEDEDECDTHTIHATYTKSIEPDTLEKPRSAPSSPSSRKGKTRARTSSASDQKYFPSSESSPAISFAAPPPNAPPTCLRKPSIRASAQRPNIQKTATFPSSTSDSGGHTMSSIIMPSSSASSHPRPLSHPHLHTVTGVPPMTRAASAPLPKSSQQQPAPEYDYTDEENLPSPFLKRTLTSKGTGTSSVSSVRVSGTGSNASSGKKRMSIGYSLRAVAAANAAAAGRRAGTNPSPSPSAEDLESGSPNADTRPSVASARRAHEEARKALLRT